MVNVRKQIVEQVDVQIFLLNKYNINMIQNLKLNYVIINITITSNNCIINLTDILGNTKYWESAGTSHFKGSKKKTPFVIQTIINNLLTKITSLNIKTIELRIKGQGNKRNLALQAFIKTKFKIAAIIDKNTIAHNGCRAPKKRKL